MIIKIFGEIDCETHIFDNISNVYVIPYRLFFRENEKVLYDLQKEDIYEKLFFGKFSESDGIGHCIDFIDENYKKPNGAYRLFFFKKGKDIYYIRTTQAVYIMNDDGKTIDSIYCNQTSD